MNGDMVEERNAGGQSFFHRHRDIGYPLFCHFSVVECVPSQVPSIKVLLLLTSCCSLFWLNKLFCCLHGFTHPSETVSHHSTTMILAELEFLNLVSNWAHASLRLLFFSGCWSVQTTSSSSNLIVRRNGKNCSKLALGEQQRTMHPFSIPPSGEISTLCCPN